MLTFQWKWQCGKTHRVLQNGMWFIVGFTTPVANEELNHTGELARDNMMCLAYSMQHAYIYIYIHIHISNILYLSLFPSFGQLMSTRHVENDEKTRVLSSHPRPPRPNHGSTFWTNHLRSKKESTSTKSQISSEFDMESWWNVQKFMAGISKEDLKNQTKPSGEN